MGDKLSAASLLLTIAGVIYSIWYPQLDAALKTKVPLHAPDRALPRGELTVCLKTRAIPLFLASLALFFVFLPDGISLALKSAKHYSQTGLQTLAQYDSVSTAFCLVVLLSATMSFHLARTVLRLTRLRRQLAT